MPHGQKTVPVVAASADAPIRAFDDGIEYGVAVSCSGIALQGARQVYFRYHCTTTVIPDELRHHHLAVRGWRCRGQIGHLSRSG